MTKPVEDDGSPAQSRAMEELRQILGFHVSMANTAIKAHFHEHFGKLRLTQKQIAILWLVGGCPGIVQIDLARLLHVKRATISIMVETLARRGLLLREAPNQADRRAVPLRLTGEGEGQLRAAKLAIARHERAIKRPLAKGDEERLRRLLLRLYETDQG